MDFRLTRTRVAVTLLGLIGAVGLLGPRPSGAQPSQPAVPSPQYQLRISQVVPREWPKFDLFVSASDGAGRPASPVALAMQAPLRVEPAEFVAKHTQPESGVPVYSVLILDKSDSMLKYTDDGEQKIVALKKGVRRFIENMKPQDRCVLIPFGSTVPEPQSLRFYSAQDPELMEQLEAVEPRADVTLLYDAISVALDFISMQKEKQRTPIVVMTDGFNNRRREGGALEGMLEGEAGLKFLIDKAQRAGLRFDTIGFGRQGSKHPGSYTSAEYRSLAPHFLDEATLDQLAAVNNPGGEALITPSPEQLGQYYQALIARYQLEAVIHCEGHTDLSQDQDPGVAVVAQAGGQEVRSNTVQLSYLVPMSPPSRHPAYGAFLQRRLLVLGGLLAGLGFLWFVPQLMGFVFGESLETAANLNQPAAVPAAAPSASSNNWGQPAHHGPASPPTIPHTTQSYAPQGPGQPYPGVPGGYTPSPHPGALPVQPVQPGTTWGHPVAPGTAPAGGWVAAAQPVPGMPGYPPAAHPYAPGAPTAGWSGPGGAAPPPGAYGVPPTTSHYGVPPAPAPGGFPVGGQEAHPAATGYPAAGYGHTPSPVFQPEPIRYGTPPGPPAGAPSYAVPPGAPGFAPNSPQPPGPVPGPGNPAGPTAAPTGGPVPAAVPPSAPVTPPEASPRWGGPPQHPG